MALTESWWEDSRNFALTASWMNDNGCDVKEIIYMLEKPWKYVEEYETALREISNDTE